LNKLSEILSDRGNFDIKGGIVGLATVMSLIEVVGISTFCPFPRLGSDSLIFGLPGCLTKLALSSSPSILLEPKLLLLVLIPPGNITSLFPKGCLSLRPSSANAWKPPPSYAKGLSP